MPSACLATCQRSKAVPFKSAELAKAAIGGNPVKPAPGFPIRFRGDALGGLVVKEGGKVFRQRRGPVGRSRRIFVRRQNPALHLFRPPLQVSQYRFRGRLVPAARRHLADDPRAVPILGGIGAGFHGRYRSPPAVSGAVRVFPFASCHCASRCPLRTMIFVPAGSGLVKVSL